MTERFRVERVGYRSLDDLLSIVRAASKLRAVQELRIMAGLVVARLTISAKTEAAGQEVPSEIDPVTGAGPAGPGLFPPPSLPSDDALERLRSAQTEWGHVRARTMGAAFLSAVVRLQAAELEPTHLLTGQGGLQQMLAAMGVPVNLLPEGGWRRFSGLEVVEHPSLDAETLLVCGGPRVHGGVAELERAIRIERIGP